MNKWLVTALQQEIEPLAAYYESIPDTMKRAVATNTLDRFTNWRLHNITPMPQAVEYLRHIWLRGERCPPLEIPDQLSSNFDAYTHIGQRTRYVLQETRFRDPALFAALQNGQGDAERFGNPTDGDLALVDGNTREARDYFRAAVRSHPNDPEAWAGFTLTFEHDTSAAAQALLHAPELLAALYAAIGSPSLTPEEVSTWVANCKVKTLIDTAKAA